MNPTQIGWHSAWITIFSDCSHCATAGSARLSPRKDVAERGDRRRQAGVLRLAARYLIASQLIRVAPKHAESRSLVVERTRVGAVGFGVCPMFVPAPYGISRTRRGGRTSLQCHRTGRLSRRRLRPWSEACRRSRTPDSCRSPFRPETCSPTYIPTTPTPPPHSP